MTTSVPGQPELLADDREDEVVVRLGQPLPLLPAGAEADAPPAAVGQGVEAVAGLEAGAVGVGAGAGQPGRDAPHPVAAGEDHDGRQHRRRRAGDGEQARRHPGGEEHAADDRTSGPARCRGRGRRGRAASSRPPAGQDQGHEGVHELAQLAPLLGQDGRAEQDQADLGELGGLRPAAAPTAIQLRLPLTLTPSGVNTSICSSIDPPSSGTARRFHVRTGMRLATAAPMTPSDREPQLAAGRRCRRSSSVRSDVDAGGGQHHDQADDDEHGRRAEQQVVGGHRATRTAAARPRHGRARRLPPAWTPDALCWWWCSRCRGPSGSARVALHGLRRRRRRGLRSWRTCPSTRPPARAGRRRRGPPGRAACGDDDVHGTSVRVGHVDDGDIGRVSRQRLGDPGPVGADEHHTAQPAGPRRCTSSSTSAPLSRPPATQTTCSNASSDEAAACGLVALESSTNRTPSTIADVGDPVRVGHERAQPVADGHRRDAVRAGQRRSGQRVGDVVRRQRRGVALAGRPAWPARRRRSAAARRRRGRPARRRRARPSTGRGRPG